jgi:hypothetical protein
MKISAATCAFLVMTAVSDAASQSCPPPRSAPATADTTRSDIVLFARVRAETLRFEGTPEVRAAVSGCPQLDTTRLVIRTNLPQPVQSGVTYRNVVIDARLRAQFSDIECLLAGLPGATAADSAQIRGAPRACLRRDTIR